MLKSIALDPSAGWYTRAQAARILATVDADGIVADLLRLFFQQTQKMELWETALTIESQGNRLAIPALAKALHDANPHRRHAAARALGWISGAGRAAAIPLMNVLIDQSQPQPVREEAAESLAYLGYARAVPAIVSVIDEPDVRIRFWAVFALGSLGQRIGVEHHHRPTVVQALERKLEDREVPPGNWWSVGKEALAMLGALTPQYRLVLEKETAAILNNPDASPENRRWAESYSCSDPVADVDC